MANAVNLVEKFNKAQVERLKKKGGSLVEFSAGDTIIVDYKITEGNNTRIQSFKGVVIARSKQFSNLDASFVVRKISHGIGVERKFQLYSPLVAKITLVKGGVVNRGKLYYLRNLSGKSARIKERIDFDRIKKAKAKKSAKTAVKKEVQKEVGKEEKKESK